MKTYRSTLERYLSEPKTPDTIRPMQETCLSGLLTIADIMQAGPALEPDTLAGVGELVQELAALAYIALEEMPAA